MAKSIFKNTLFAYFIWALVGNIQAQTYTTLSKFGGVGSISSLIQSYDGELYGTMGGGNYSYGVVFKISRQGILKRLYTFCSQPDCLDGSFPGPALVLG